MSAAAVTSPVSPTETIVPDGQAATDLEKAQEIAPVKPAMVPMPDGGLMAWLAVTGAWFAVFATFGYANTFGVFQSYYQLERYPTHSASSISWIGSIQLFLQFSLGAIAGPLYDKGYFRHMVYGGSVLYVVCLFMTSLAHEFWQTVLAQALGIGLGIGFIFLPAVSIISQYFLKRRAFAMGIVTTGSSVGGIALPIMLNKLIVQHGFERAVQYTGYVILAALVIACALMHPRFVPASMRPAGADAKKPSPKQLFSKKPYALLVAGLFCVAWGLFFPIYYLQVFAQDHGLSENLVFYTLAILNAASVFGRISPNFLADYIGSLNLLFVMCTGAGILCFAVFGAGTSGGLIAVAILFGFFSGGYVSLLNPALIAMADHHGEIGIRLGLGFLVTSFAALTGTPITGALLVKYGFYAPIIWSGVTILAGSVFLVSSIMLQRREKGTWKV